MIALYALAGMVEKGVEQKDSRGVRGPMLAIGEMIAAAATTAVGTAAAGEGGAGAGGAAVAAGGDLTTVTLVAASAVARAARHPLNDLHLAACLSLSRMGTLAPLPLLPPSLRPSWCSDHPRSNRIPFNRHQKLWRRGREGTKSRSSSCVFGCSSEGGREDVAIEEGGSGGVFGNGGSER